MESSLKQRLIGAAVLVALAVIFLPMLLDSPPPEPGTGTVTLDIPPAPGRDFETRALPLAPPPGRTDAATAAPADDPNRVVSVDADAPDRVDARPEDAPTTPAGVSAPADTAAAPAEPASADPAPTGSPAAGPAVAAEPPPDAAPPRVPPAPRSDGRFAVNLGSFGNLANAEALLKRLKAGGVAAYSESIRIDGKPALRLRAGPFAARGDAEAARIAAQRIEPGLSAGVVTLDASAPAPAQARSGFAVQVGAFRDAGDAAALRDRLRGAGLAAFIDEVATDEGRLHRVRIGPETARERAESLLATVKQRFQLEGMVVTHP